MNGVMIVTLYKGFYCNGIGERITLNPGDKLTDRKTGDQSFELKRAGPITRAVARLRRARSDRRMSI